MARASFARLFKLLADWVFLKLKEITGLLTRTTKMSSEKDSTPLNSPKISKYLYKQVLDKVIAKQGFRFVKFMASGENGAVAEMVNTYLREPIAVKVEPFRDQVVIQSWLKIKHPNVLPLIAVIPIEGETDDDSETEEDELNFNWTAYIMPLYSGTLDCKISSSDFRNSSHSLQQTSSWLWDILNALHYLHRKNLYHLDLKPNNVLLGRHGEAILADFTYLNNRNEVDIKSIGCPIVLQPPESLLGNEKSVLRSDKVDVWCLGMLLGDILTAGRLDLVFEMDDLSSTVSSRGDGCLASSEFVERRQESLKILKSTRRLKAVIEQMLPFALLDSDTVSGFSKLFETILRKDPEERPSTDELIRQPFVLFSQPENLIKFTSSKFLGLPTDIARQCSLHWWETDDLDNN